MKRIIAAVLIVGLLAVPSCAYAVRKEHKETFTITTEAEIPSGWIDPAEGHYYQLITTNPHGVFNEGQAKHVSKTVGPITAPSGEVIPVQTPALRSRFPEYIQIDEAGSQGELSLTHIETAPVYTTLKRQVDRVSEMMVPTNDIEELPREMAFETSSGTQQLRRAAVSYEIAERDDTLTQRGEDGLPLTYKATMTFRGVEEYEEITSYTAIAYYEGDIFGGQVEEQVEATYVYDSDETTAPIAVGSAAPTRPAAPKSTNSIVPVAATSTGMAILILCVGVTRNARIYTEDEGGLRLIGLAHIKQSPRGFQCVVPSWINLAKHVGANEHLVMLPGKRVKDQNGDFVVTWRKQTLFTGEMSRRIQLIRPTAPVLEQPHRSSSTAVTGVAVAATALLILGAVAIGSGVIRL